MEGASEKPGFPLPAWLWLQFQAKKKEEGERKKGKSMPLKEKKCMRIFFFFNGIVSGNGKGYNDNFSSSFRLEKCDTVMQEMKISYIHL